MKRTLRSAAGLMGLGSVALIGMTLSSSVVTTVHELTATAAAQTASASRAGLPAARARSGIVEDPVAKRRLPKLWTVRSRFDALIDTVARRHDMDPALVKAIVQAESAFDPNAVSRSGARGLMQVLPETASRFSIANLSDPHQNLKAGVLYLKHLIELFDGNVTMAVAAYKAGPNRVRRYRGVPPYSETRNYLTKVMGLRTAYADQRRSS
ncbi:MAG: lytic transglycosylase domain-containing protein [Gammaproteobacteria bacterium]|nr:lytic transglycosylase domain-containing protein [Gammaproteobacteria bacterium]